MKSLELSSVDVREIPSDFLAKVINRIEKVVLHDIKIEALQIENIFIAILRGDSVLKGGVLPFLLIVDLAKILVVDWG